MKAYTYFGNGRSALADKPVPQLQGPCDALVRVTLGSICTSDLHILHGSVPRAVPGITLGHEMVGVVEAVGSAVDNVRPGDRVAVNVETFCGECFFCRHGYVNNCSDPLGGWALGCRIDGGQAEYVRVPYADQGLTRIPDGVSDSQALFTGDLGHRPDYRCRTDRYMHPAVRDAPPAPPHHRVREIPGAQEVRAGTLSRGDGDRP